MSRRRNLFAVLLVAGACMPASQVVNPSSDPLDTNRTSPKVRAERWADSVLSSLTIRDKAAQMVWPTVLGDYTSGNSPQWQRLTNYVSTEKVGRFTIPLRSMTDVASKLITL